MYLVYIPGLRRETTAVYCVRTPTNLPGKTVTIPKMGRAEQCSETVPPQRIRLSLDKSYGFPKRSKGQTADN